MLRRGTWSRGDLVVEGLGRNKMLFGSQRGRTANGQTATAGSRRSLRPEDRSPASCWLLALKSQTDSNSSLSSHLAHFLACPIGRPCFRFAGSWIVGLAMGEAESRGADVAVGFSGWSLWKVLTIFRRCMTAEEGF